MKKCDYCEKKIGFFSVMYSWLDKKQNLSVHDVCLEEWYIKFQNKQKTLESITKIDYTTLSENQRLEIREIIDEIFKDIDKDLLYLYAHKPKWISHEECIKIHKRQIEDIKKDENYPNKEKILELNNELLKQLKNEDDNQKEMKLAEAQNRLKEISFQRQDWKYIIASIFMGILLGLILYLLTNT